MKPRTKRQELLRLSITRLPSGENMFLQTVTRLFILGLLTSTQSLEFQTPMAFQSKDAPPQSSASSQKNAKVWCAIEILPNTAGVDLSSYVREVFLSTKERWFADMPPSIERGQKGLNSVEFRILQDGSVPKDSIKVVRSSEKSDFDAASMNAVRDASPFKHLPENYSKPFIEVRIIFAYNVPYAKSVGHQRFGENSPES